MASSHGSRTFDIRDSGALETIDNAMAIQAAIELAKGVASNVFVPSGSFRVDSPVFHEYDSANLTGEGAASSVWANGSFPAFFVGTKRREFWGGPYAGMPQDFATDHRVDLFGVLDASAADHAGYRFGLASRSPSGKLPAGSGDHYLTIWGGAPCFGAVDHWKTTRKPHVAYAIKKPDGGPMTAGPILGLGAKDDFGKPSPWLVQAGDTLFSDKQFHFYFRTAEGVRQSEASRDFSFGNLDDKGLQRHDVWVDYTRNGPDGLCPIYAAVNGKLVPVTRGWGTRLKVATATEPSFTAEDNLHFATNEGSTFHAFAQAYGINYPLMNMIVDLELCGMRILNDSIYKDGEPGTDLVRLDGATINDDTRYFNTVDFAKTICWLPLNDLPHEPTRTTDRLFAVSAGGPGGLGLNFGLFSWNERDYSTDNSARNQRIEHLHVASQGVAVAFGCCFHLTCEDVTFDASWWSAASLGLGGYDYRFIDCNFVNSHDAWLMASSMLIDEISGCRRSDVGRCAFHLVGSRADIKSIICGNLNYGGQITDCIVKGDNSSTYASQCAIGRIELDNENNQAPREALVVYARHQNWYTCLEVSDIVTGNMPPGVPCVKLTGGKLPIDGSYGPGICRINKVLASDGLIVVGDGGSGWDVEVRDSILHSKVQPAHSDGVPGVRFVNCITVK